MPDTVDAIVVGAGPNGLAAALTLAQAGRSVRVYEAAATPGGGCRTAELTLPGFRHDVCSTIQSMAEISPFFRELDLDALGVRLRTPSIACAHPLDGGRAVAVYEDLARTCDELGVDAAAWRTLFGPLVRHADDLMPDVLGDLRGLSEPYPLTVRREDDDGTRYVTVGEATVAMRGHVVRVLDTGDELDLLRAGATIIWESGLAIYGLDVDPKLHGGE